MPFSFTPNAIKIEDNIIKQYAGVVKGTCSETEYDLFYYPKAKMEMISAAIMPIKIIYNNPATIVFWKDGTKTVVKCANGEIYNKYHGFCAAVTKKIFGNNSKIGKIVRSGEDQKIDSKKEENK